MRAVLSGQMHFSKLKGVFVGVLEHEKAGKIDRED
jgi:hypothetical protein